MTPLQQANHALQRQDYASAIPLYVRALQQCVPLAPVLVGNLHRAQKAYRAQRAKQGAHQRPHVLVSSWDLSLNATGRAATLAQIWAGIGQAEVIGCLYPPKKTQLWAPLQDFPLPIHPLHVAPGQSFVAQALDFVLAHPCDLLHLSKPRWPNIVLGLLYKLVWACPVWMDVDDEELAFAKADSPITLGEYLQTAACLPETSDSVGSAASTRLGVGLANAFDAVTVVNPALQQRYGGSIVRHARDAAHFAPSAQRRSQARAKLGIAPGDTVILFAGTPRAHKGLLETAQAIAQQQRSDLVFLIVGDFPANLRSLQQQIARMPGLKTIMLPNQNFQTLPDTLAAGDICVLLQDKDSLVAQYQTPAKLTDALAMGLTVLATPTPALADVAEHGAFTPVAEGQLAQVLAATLVKHQRQAAAQPEPHPLFKQLLTTSANQITLSQLWKKIAQAQDLNIRLLALAGKLDELEALLPAGAKKNPITTEIYSAEKEDPPYNRYIQLNQKIINWKALEQQVKETDKVSIIIPIYNQLVLTKKCLLSVLKSKTKINYEIICVNNGSDANMDSYLKEICYKNKNIFYVKNPENYNFALGCNIGFSKASGSTIIFLNNDTEVTDGWLDNLIRPLENEAVVAVQPKLLFPDSTIQNIGIVFSKKQVFGYPIYANFNSHNDCTNISRHYQAVTGACMAIRSKDFNKAQGFDPLFINGMEDVDLCLRLTHGTSRTCYYQASSVVIHHESKTQGRGKYLILNRENFYQRWIGKIIPDDEKFYLHDGFEIIGWKKYSEKIIDSNLTIHRPVLKMQAI